MLKHIQTIRREQPTNCFSLFKQFVGLALKGLKWQYFGSTKARFLLC